jgi:hypothetical protein
MIQAAIAGIPCQIEVTHLVTVPADHSADSDWDYAGYTEIEFDVYDRKGYPATWLEKKMTNADISKIEALILQEAS